MRWRIRRRSQAIRSSPQARRKAAPYTVRSRFVRLTVWRCARIAHCVRPRRLANASYRGKTNLFRYAVHVCTPRVPDHVHLLVEEDNRRCRIARLHCRRETTCCERRETIVRGRLWQPGYDDRILRDRDDAYAVIKYILENPLRAGLAKTPEEYPFIGGTRVSSRTPAV
jgi:hypothetical protein